MICVIDIGNSNIVIGLMKSDQEILFTGRIRSNRDQTTEQFFVEVKAPGEKPRPLQIRRHEQLRQLGFRVAVLDDPEQIPSILEETRR